MTIVKQHQFDPKQTWMIGNSVRTDIEPGLLAGLNVIYIKHLNEWHYNLVDIETEPQDVLYTIEQVTDIPQVIQTWLFSQLS